MTDPDKAAALRTKKENHSRRCGKINRGNFERNKKGFALRHEYREVRRDAREAIEVALELTGGKP